MKMMFVYVNTYILMCLSIIITTYRQEVKNDVKVSEIFNRQKIMKHFFCRNNIFHLKNEPKIRIKRHRLNNGRTDKAAP